MAYALTQKDKELKDIENASGITQTGPNDIASAQGEGVASDQQQTTDTVAGATPSSTSSGRFVNLQNYIDANKPQATKLASSVASNIQSKVGEATSALSQAQEKFKTDVDAGTVKYDKDVVEKAINAPSTFVASPESKKFSDILSGEYKGPDVTTSTDTWSPAMQKVQAATQAGELTKSSGGQTELLRGIAETPYSRGGLSFNQLLLQNTEPARQQLAQAAEATKPLTTSFNTALTQAQQDVNSARAESAASRQQLLDKIAGEGGVVTSYEKELQNRVNALRSQEHALQTDVINQIKTGTITQENLDKIGLTQAQLDNLVAKNKEAETYGGGVDISSYIRSKSPEQYINIQSASTPEEVLRYNALNKLIGREASMVLTPSEAGTANQQNVGLDMASANAELSRQIEAGKVRRENAAANAEFAKNQKEAMKQSMKAAQRAQMQQAILSIATMAVMIFSDKNLKKNKEELTGDQLSDILDSLTNGSKK